jgi:hypothetical protein
MPVAKTVALEKIGENQAIPYILKGAVWKEGVGKNGDFTGI